MSRARALAWLVLLALLAVAGWRGWHGWLDRDPGGERVPPEQWRALDARLDALRRDQRAQAQRIAHGDANARVLREEVLGVGQRAALLQDSLDQLAGPTPGGDRALRLDEVEWLLLQGTQRLQLAGDLDGTRRAYALAASTLARIDDPRLLDLRQALAQERAALEAAGPDPRAAALAALDTFASALSPPATDTGGAKPSSRRPWWRRAFSRLVQVQPSDRALAVAPGERAAGFAALQLELTLARSAAERRDAQAWDHALQRADAWLARLWPATPAAAARRRQLAALRGLPLQVDLPAFGSTLRQLQARHAAPAPGAG